MSLGTYNSGTLKEGQIRVSPSSVKDLIYNRPFWIKKNVLHHEYKMNTKSLDTGTAFHHLVEMYIEGKEFKESIKEVFEWLESKGHTDMWEYEEKLTKMFDIWLDNLQEFADGNVATEKWLEFEPNDEVMISGTLDAMYGDTIVDWKTSASRKSDLEGYKHQLYLYAFLARKNNIEVNNIGAVVVKTPAKRKKEVNGENYGSSAIDILIEPINEEFMNDFISELQEAVKDMKEVINEPKILNWIEKTSIPDPFARGF